MTEEERAELHRQQERNRVTYRRVQNTKLKGDPVKAKAFKKAWKPITEKRL